MTIHAQIRMEERAKDSARRAAKEADREAQWKRSQALGAQKAAEKAQRDAEAKAEAERAYAIRYAAMSPLERECEDHHRATLARLAAAEVTTTPTKTDRPKPTVGAYMPEATNPNIEADALEARARELSAKADAAPSEANRYVAMVADAEAVKARALARFKTEQKAADEAVSEAERAAGDDPVRRAREKARVAGNHADRVGQAERAYQAAELAHDQAVIETAKAARLAAHRIESRKAQILADEAKALNDPQAMGNPYYKPPVSLARWQYEALPPEAKARAFADGVRVYDDPEPPFTAADAMNILRSRGSANRPVVTRAELAAMDPAEQVKAARSAIIVD